VENVRQVRKMVSWNGLLIVSFIIISNEIAFCRVRTKQQGKLCKFVEW